MNSIKIFFALIILLGTFSMNVLAQQQSAGPAFSTGPIIGETVPDFSLPDQSGQMRNLRELLGPKGALLNFYRSASW